MTAVARGGVGGGGIRGGPAAHVVDAEVVVVHVDAKEAAFAPVRAPGVAANPVPTCNSYNNAGGEERCTHSKPEESTPQPTTEMM